MEKLKDKLVDVFREHDYESNENNAKAQAAIDLFCEVLDSEQKRWLLAYESGGVCERAMIEVTLHEIEAIKREVRGE